MDDRLGTMASIKSLAGVLIISRAEELVLDSMSMRYKTTRVIDLLFHGLRNSLSPAFLWRRLVFTGDAFLELLGRRLSLGRRLCAGSQAIENVGQVLAVAGARHERILVGRDSSLDVGFELGHFLAGEITVA